GADSACLLSRDLGGDRDGRALLNSWARIQSAAGGSERRDRRGQSGRQSGREGGRAGRRRGLGSSRPWRAQGCARRTCCSAPRGRPSQIAGYAAQQLLDRQQALRTEQLHQGKLPMEPLLLGVIQIVEGAQDDLQVARQLFL